MIPIWLYLLSLFMLLVVAAILIWLVQKHMSQEFTLLAQQVLAEKQERMQTQSQSILASTIEPLQQELKGFQQRMEHMHTHQTHAGGALLTEVQQLKQLNQQMNQAAADLTQALQGNHKIQGDWGEFVLEKLLEQTGLTKGREYEVQKTHRDNEGQLKRPDVIIHLPEQRDVMIDAKVSLQAYTQYVQAEDQPRQQQALAEHVQSVRRHIQLLSSKAYTELVPNALEMVLLFMPIEAAYLLAVQQYPDLFEEAFRRKVMLVSPSSLFGVLKMIHRIWQQEQQNQNAQLIAKKAAGLYSKFRGFVEDINRLERQMHTAFKTLDQTKTKPHTGRGNIVQQVQEFETLGVAADKPIA